MQHKGMLLLRGRWLIPCLLVAFAVLPRQTGTAAQGPVKGKIAFVANVAGNWDLFLMNSDGSDLLQLTETPLDERAPAISPDGQKIAYSTSDGALWIITLGAKEPMKLPLPEGRYNYPSWSPTGASLVYTVYTFSPHGEDADLWMYTFEDGKNKQLLTQTGVQDFSQISPSGDSLLYSSSGTATLAGSGVTVIQQLWLASLRDGKVKQLLLAHGKDTEPAWSPDATRIVFSSDRAGNPDLWLMSTDGDHLTQLTSGVAAKTHPVWSPSGQEIAYISAASGGMALMVMDVQSRRVRQLTPFGVKQVDIRDPDWR
jgi:Tol biopolymer transport system component